MKAQELGTTWSFWLLRLAKAGEDCWGFTQAPTEKDTECVEMQHPPIGQAEPYTTVSAEETYKTLSTSKWREEKLILKGKETGYQTAGEKHIR